MSQDYLGEFEQMVLLSIMRLDDEAYGLAISEEMERVAGRSPSSGALYTTLDRLERKGLVESTAGDASEECLSFSSASGAKACNVLRIKVPMVYPMTGAATISAFPPCCSADLRTS